MRKALFTPHPEESYVEFPHLIFYSDEANNIYFDATHYLISSYPAGEKTIEEFLEVMKFQIDNVREGFGIPAGDFIVENKQNGHLMMVEIAEFLFISYADTWFLSYIHMRMRELFAVGFTTSDSMLIGLVKARFDKDI